MKRSLQEYVELVVFGLIALLVGTGLLWVGGWLLSLVGIVLKGLAGLLWMLLRFVVPVAIAAGLVYFLVKAAQGRKTSESTSASGSAAVPTGAPASYTPPAAAAAGGAATVESTVAEASDMVQEFDAADVDDAIDATGAAAGEAADDVADDVTAAAAEAESVMAEELESAADELDSAADDAAQAAEDLADQALGDDEDEDKA